MRRLAVALVATVSLATAAYGQSSRDAANVTVTVQPYLTLRFVFPPGRSQFELTIGSDLEAGARVGKDTDVVVEVTTSSPAEVWIDPTGLNYYRNPDGTRGFAHATWTAVFTPRVSHPGEGISDTRSMDASGRYVYPVELAASLPVTAPDGVFQTTGPGGIPAKVQVVTAYQLGGP